MPHPFHLTFVTHNSRYSQRMKDHKVELGEAFEFSEKEEVVMSSIIADICQRERERLFKVLAYNICVDHVHILITSSDSAVEMIAKKIKGESAKIFNDYCYNSYKKSRRRIWAQKFSKSWITSDEKLISTINYINYNRTKHDLPDNPQLVAIAKRMIVDMNEAFIDPTGG